MRPRPSNASPPPESLVTAVTEEAAAQAHVWFPDLEPARLRTTIGDADARARCFLYRVQLDDGRSRRSVLVKVRHSHSSLRRLDRYQQRPVLNPERTMSDHDSARREYDALAFIAEALADADRERFGVLRALAWLPEQSAIIMDLVEEPTLRTRLLEASRLQGRRGLQGRRSVSVDRAAWANAGALLRIVHDHPDPWELPARNGDRDDVVALYRGLCDFLGQRLGSSSLLAQLTAAAGMVENALPAALPLRTGHGDFVANNMFVSPTGRITVFDPLPRWRVAIYQDLATLTMGIRLIPLQAASQGFALPADVLDTCEQALLTGYFGSDQPPMAAIRAYQLLVLLDRWSALVSKRIPNGRVRPQLHEMRVRVATKHYRAQARRLLVELSTADSGVGTRAPEAHQPIADVADADGSSVTRGTSRRRSVSGPH